MDFNTQSAAYIERIESGIERILPSADTRPGIIHEAMRYSVQAGGKRLRPTLVLAAADMVGSTLDALPAAVAIECLHTYSLIHDDMPCVDNSDLRRGRATSHRRFGEAMALLAGDALLTEAFRILGSSYAGEEKTGYALTHVLSQAASSTALIGGQVEDVLGEGREISKADLDFIHLNKTAALISAALEMGLLHAEPGEEDIVAIRKAGRAMGLAFQIVDDVLDATSDAARSRAVELTDEAVTALRRWGPRADFLVALAEDMARRVR